MRFFTIIDVDPDREPDEHVLALQKWICHQVHINKNLRIVLLTFFCYKLKLTALKLEQVVVTVLRRQQRIVRLAI